MKLVEQYAYVIGGDPDRDTVDLAGTGATTAHTVGSADGAGYAAIFTWAKEHVPGRRVWALEGTGSFAAGLATFLAQDGEDVVEVGGAKRGRGAKNDKIDAVRAARTALGRDQQASPRARGLREALRVVLTTRHAVLVSRTKAINELKSLVVVAPEHLRAGLRGHNIARQLGIVEQLPTAPDATVEHRTTVLALRSVAARIRFLSGQVDELDTELAALLAQHPAGPALLAEPGRARCRRTAARQLVPPRPRPQRSRLRRRRPTGSQ